MFRRAILLATFVTAGMFLPAEAQVATEVRTSMGAGSITYNPQMFARPDIVRLTSLRLLLNDFAYERCTTEFPDYNCVLPKLEHPNIHIAILPYADFEALVIEWFERQHPENLPRLLGDGLLIGGLTHRRSLGDHDVRVTYFQIPSDTLWVHELMHVIFPYDDEEDVKGKVNLFMSGHEYKDWLRENY